MATIERNGRWTDCERRRVKDFENEENDMTHGKIILNESQKDSAMKAAATVETDTSIEIIRVSSPESVNSPYGIDEDAGKLKYSDLEYERYRSRCLDREWSEKVLLVIGFAILLFGIAILFVDTSPIQAILMKICDFMMSYINFSYKVLCDMFSFIVGLLFVGVFIFTIISITFIHSD